MLGSFELGRFVRVEDYRMQPASLSRSTNPIGFEVAPANRLSEFLNAAPAIFPSAPNPTVSRAAPMIFWSYKISTMESVRKARTRPF